MHIEHHRPPPALPGGHVNTTLPAAAAFCVIARSSDTLGSATAAAAGAASGTTSTTTSLTGAGAAAAAGAGGAGAGGASTAGGAGGAAAAAASATPCAFSAFLATALTVSSAVASCTASGSRTVRPDCQGSIVVFVVSLRKACL